MVECSEVAQTVHNNNIAIAKIKIAECSGQSVPADATTVAITTSTKSPSVLSNMLERLKALSG